MDHTFSQTDTPGAYRCTCGWTGSDYLSHRQETTLAALRQAPGQPRTIHETPR